ncbi:MAG: translocation/assembly module TamB domain-containing protein [Deltaproteobacteria bacterium]|nr:translocation/assembly module TamB domain-containing protein [Deltaproteobacteria bacterium]
MPNNWTWRWFRRATWVFGSLISLLLLVLLAATLYMRTARFQEWVRSQAVAALSTSLNGEVSIEGISGSIWSEIVFHNLSVRQNNMEILSIPQGTLAVQLFRQIFSFFSSSTLHISSLTLTTPTLRLVQDPHTGWNIATLVKPAPQPQKPSTLRLYVDRIGMNQGDVIIRNPAGEESRLTALSMDGSLAVLPAGTQVDLSSLTFSLGRADIPAVQWNGGLAYDATQSPAVLTLRHTDLRSGDSHVQIAGSVHDLSAPIVALTVDITQLASGDVQRLAPSVPLQQDLSGTLQVSGPLSALQLEATLKAPDGRVTTTTTVNLRQTPPHYQGTLAVERFTLDKVLKSDKVGGEVSAQLSFAGESLQAGEGTLQAQAADLVVRGQKIGNLAVSGNLAKGQVVFTGEARGPVGAASWKSQLRLGTPLAYEVNLTARNIIPAPFLENKITLPLHLNFDAWVKGRGTSLAEIDAATKLTLLESQLGSLTNVRGQMTGKLQQQQLTLDSLTLEANDTTLTAQGKLGDILQTPHGAITYTVLSQNLTPWLALLGQRGAGALRLEGSTNGALTALQVEGKATLSHFHIATSTLQNGALSYTFSGIGSPQPHGQVTATLTQMAAGISWRTAQVNLTLSGTQPVEVQTQFIGQDQQKRTHRLATQIHYQPERVEVLISELALQLPTGTWHNSQPARLLLQNKTLTIENFLLQQADHTVSATGTFAWQGQQNLQVQITRVPLADLQALLRPGPQISGSLSTELRVQGTATAPEIAMDLNTSAITVAGQTYTGLTAHVGYHQKQLQVNALLQQDLTHTLTIAGGIPLSLQWEGEPAPPTLGEADLRVHSTGLSLAFLNSLSPEIQDVKGTVSINLQVRGPLQALVPSGTVQLQQGQVRVKALGFTLQDIAAQAELAPGTIAISQLTVRAHDGQLTGNGRLSLQHYTITNFELSLNADRFRVIDTREYRAAVSGQLSGSGSLEHPVLRGDVKLVETTLRPDFSLLKSGPAKPDPTIVVIRTEQDLQAQMQQPTQSTAQSGEPPLSGSVYDGLSIDLTVTVPRGTWVYLDEGTLELMGQIRLRKDAAQELVFVGTIETVRGWYTFHNRKFNLERGQVIFTGSTPIDPSLDIVARYTLKNYKIDLVVTGTARTPALTLRSEPSLEQADLVSMLIFGKTTDGLSSGEKSSLQSEVLSATAGYFANDLRRSVAEQLGIDDLEFDIGKTIGESRIGAGKYLSQDIYVSTSQATGSKNNQGQEFALDYQLDVNWQLKASTTTEGNSGIDIFWEKRY